MITFVLLAAALTMASVVVVATPLLRRGAQGSPGAPWTALVAAGLLVLVLLLPGVLSRVFNWALELWLKLL